MCLREKSAWQKALRGSPEHHLPSEGRPEEGRGAQPGLRQTASSPPRAQGLLVSALRKSLVPAPQHAEAAEEPLRLGAAGPWGLSAWCLGSSSAHPHPQPWVSPRMCRAAASSGGIQAHGSPLLPLSGGCQKALGNPLRYQEVDVHPSQQPEPLLPAGGHTLAVPWAVSGELLHWQPRLDASAWSWRLGFGKWTWKWRRRFLSAEVAGSSG